MQTLSFILHAAQLQGSNPYIQAISIITNANNYQGTPYTIWGGLAVPHANAVIFGNSSSATGGTLASLSHEQVLYEFAHPHDQFAWSEYAAADVYVAVLCASLHNSAAVCGQSFIQQIQRANGY